MELPKGQILRCTSPAKAQERSRKLRVKHTVREREITLQEDAELLSQAEARALRYAAANRTP